MLGYCAAYIFMQTFMIPGTIFLSLLAGALFGVIRGVMLVVFTATTGASSCYFLSKLIGRPLILWLWPEKLRFFQSEVYCSFIFFYFSQNEAFASCSLPLLLFFTDCKAKRQASQLHALFANNSIFT